MKEGEPKRQQAGFFASNTGKRLVINQAVEPVSKTGGNTGVQAHHAH